MWHACLLGPVRRAYSVCAACVCMCMCVCVCVCVRARAACVVCTAGCCPDGPKAWFVLVVVRGLVDGTEYTAVALQCPVLQVIGRSCRLGCPLGGPGAWWVLGETSAGPGPHCFCDSSMVESRSVTGGPTAAALPWLECSRSEPQGGSRGSPESLGEAGRT